MARVLLIDDDLRLADMVGRYLREAGFDVTHAPDAAHGLARLASGPDAPDIVLLDLMLPDADGLDVCRDIRRLPSAVARVPVLMLTARGETTDRVVGLEMGADDYLPKPFEPRELLARVRAQLRRMTLLAGANAMPVVAPGAAAGAGAAGPAVTGEDASRFESSPASASVPGSLGADSGDDDERLVFGRLMIEPGARRVSIDGEDRQVTAYQFDLLMALASHAGRVMSRERLMDLVKGEALEAFDRSIDVHVGKIRQAIEDDPRHPRRLLTVRGAGYVFARQQDR